MVKKKATTNTVIPPAAKREQRVVAAAHLSLARRSHLPQPKTMPFINDILVNCELDVQGRSYCANIYGLCYARS